MASDTSPVEQGIEVAIEKMVYGGEGLSRTPEGVVLTAGVIAGERARVIAEPARKGVRRGRLVELLEPGADRVAADCPYYARCGGCQYQHIAYARQLQIKQQILAECFERIGKLRLETSIQLLASDPWHYRNRIRLQVEKQSSAFRIGYREHASHTLVPVDCCPIALPALDAVVHELAQGALSGTFPDGPAELELFGSESGGSLLATVYSPHPAPASFGETWRQTLAGFESVCWAQTAARKPIDATRDTVWGSGGLTYRASDLHYRVSHHSFFQANSGLLLPMIEAAVGALSGARALDLYAGVGFFTVPLSRRFERVAAVEAHPAAAADLAANAGVGGTRVQVHHKTAEQFLAATSRNWDAILVDPPRSGLARPVLDGLRRLSAPQLVYVSCDPTTLARDVASLIASGYRIASVHLADQFPQTFHIEAIVHLSRAG
jgi:23S rRNA (uracil1939-C5)-methyltransferase